MKIKLNKLLCGEPIKIANGLKIFQPTIRDITSLGYEYFGRLYNIYNITRKNLLREETNETWNLSDYDVLVQFLCHDKELNKIFSDSVLFFMHKKVEFLKVQGSIFIGELESGIELTEELFSEIQSVIKQITLQKEVEETQIKRTKRAQEIHDKIVAGQKRLEEIKDEKGEDQFAEQIVSIVAHGHSYDAVYDMTLIQFKTLLEKIVQIENYTISTMLSPYMNKKNKKNQKHWLE